MAKARYKRNRQRTTDNKEIDTAIGQFTDNGNRDSQLFRKIQFRE
nr:MAG TPA: hypothetical protein [Caudoviricetes sp.]